jgi:hypothetical protein
MLDFCAENGITSDIERIQRKPSRFASPRGTLKALPEDDLNVTFRASRPHL